jgi:hypothetical protein
MPNVRYHSRTTDGARAFHEVILNGEHYHANADMGFIELPDTEMGREYARSLGIEPMEGEPTLPVVLADSRIIAQHSAEIAQYESRLEAMGADMERSTADLDKRVHELTDELKKAKAERDTAMADKTRLLENYERALAKIDALGTPAAVKLGRELRTPPPPPRA